MNAEQSTGRWVAECADCIWGAETHSESYAKQLAKQHESRYAKHEVIVTVTGE